MGFSCPSYLRQTLFPFLSPYSAFFFFFKFFYCKVLALQHCAGFCHTSTWISHRCTYVSSLLNALPSPTTYLVLFITLPDILFMYLYLSVFPQFSSVQSLNRVWLFATPWTAVRQASLFITNSWSLLKLTSIESVMLSNHLILCCSLLLLPSIFPSIRVFSNESALRIRWPKYWSFSFSISPSNEYSGLISFRIDWLDLLAVQGTLKSLL